MENVIAFPHLGASTEESEDNCAIMAVKQLMAYVEKGEIINSVNYPNVKLDHLTDKTRIVILAKNQPTIAREIDKIFTQHESYISHRVSKVKGDYAYYAIDLTIDLPIDLVEVLNNIEGINRVRVI